MGLGIASFSRFITEMNDRTREEDAEGLARWAIAELSQTIGFDAAWYGWAKLRMVERWMADKDLARGDAHIRFFSDHVSDAPCLDWADEGFAVNAHAPLRALAKKRGWAILDWR